MASDDFVAKVTAGFLDVIEPLTDALSSEEEFAALLRDMGWTLETNPNMGAVSTAFGGVTGKVATLASDVSSGAAPPALAADVQAIVVELGKLGVASALPQPLNSTAFWDTFPQEILELLLYEYLEEHVPFLFGVLAFLGVICLEVRTADTATGRNAYVRRTIDWSRLGSSVSAPQDIFADVYGWGGSELEHGRLLWALRALLAGFHAAAQLYPASDPFLDLYYDADNEHRLEVEQLVASPFQLVAGGDGVSGYVKPSLLMLPIPPKADRAAKPEGIALVPLVTGAAAATIPLATGVDLSLAGSFSTDVIRLAIRPANIEAAVGGATASLSASARVDVAPAAPLVVAGDPGSTRIELIEAHLLLAVAGPPATPEATVEAAVDEARAVLDLAEGDGFLQKVLGTEPRTIDLAAGIAWSTSDGVRFLGAPRPEIEIPVHLTIAGVLSVDTVYVAARPGEAPGAGAFEVAVAGGLTIGPVSASVERVGVLATVAGADVSKPANLGLVEVGFGFKPPSGIGIGIDAGPVGGGGFIYFDHEKGRYSGILHLQLTTIGITAIAILDTKLPGGQPGYSFLIIVAAEFPPIQLGFGFTLNGLGGLAGIHRTVVIDALQAGVRSGSVDHILFPEDPVRDAPQILASLSSVFPPVEGRYVFGPMAILAWGTPPLIEGELGVLLELPAPIRLVVLGQLSMALPEKEAAVLELRLDVLGVIEFEARRLSLDAVLVDSRLATFPLTGEMALRLSWADPPTFAVAIGGFHPRFQPPPGFPALPRVTLSIAAENGNPSLVLQLYVALTSNTLQIGARGDLAASELGFSLIGWLGFDVLAVLRPFSLEADLTAGVVVKKGGLHIATVGLVARLTGPAPWHLTGKASFDCIVRTEVPIEAVIGEPAAQPLPPPLDPWPLLKAALEDARNWQVEAAATAEQVCSLRRPADPDLVLLDPLGAAAVQERVLPLNCRMGRFGEGPIAGPDRYNLTRVAVGAATRDYELLRDYFAPAQFEDLDDTAKLSRPAFEKMNSGFSLGTDALSLDGNRLRARRLVLDTVIVDRADGSNETTVDETRAATPLTQQRQLAFLAQSAAAASPLAASGEARYEPSPGGDSPARLADERYVIVRKDTLQPPTGGPPAQVGRSAAEAAVADYVDKRPEQHGLLTVVPELEVT